MISKDGVDMKVAAVQLNAEFSQVGKNLHRCENQVRQAALEGAGLVLLPEFFTSAIGFSEKMLKVCSQSKNVERQLKRWSAEYNVIVGGSYIHFDGSNAYNLFQLVFPNGETYQYKKDLPTQFENCYFTAGDEDNMLSTPIGNIGVALCWEMIRYDTLARLSGKVDIILAGSCWWDLPQDSPPEREPLRRYNQNLALQTPVVLAKLLGTTVIHASHCGKVTAVNFPDGDKTQTRQLVGAAQIIDTNGEILARRQFDEGEGIVFAKIPIDGSKRSGVRVFPNRYWIPDLPESYLTAWETINPKAKIYYEATAFPYYKSSC